MMDSTLAILALAAAQAAAVAFLVRGLIDALKMAVDPPRWLSPPLALLLGPVILTLLSVAAGSLLTQALLAQNGIAGLIAGLAAIGSVELSKREKHEGDA